MLVNPNKLTMQVALAQLKNAHSTDYSVVMTGALIAMIPLMMVFLLFARLFVRDAIRAPYAARTARAMVTTAV